MNPSDRVQAHTAPKVNEHIEEEAQARVAAAAQETRDRISDRIRALDREWDIERWLEMNASALGLTGLVLGLTVHRRFLALPAVVLPFLLLHAVQGWCPPLPIFRRKGVRTRREIDQEKYALKALRGDFASVPASGNGTRSRQAWSAATSD